MKDHPKCSSQRNQSMDDAVALFWVFYAKMQLDLYQKRCLGYEELIKRALKRYQVPNSHSINGNITLKTLFIESSASTTFSSTFVFPPPQCFGLWSASKPLEFSSWESTKLNFGVNTWFLLSCIFYFAVFIVSCSVILSLLPQEIVLGNRPETSQLLFPFPPLS